MVNAKWPAYLEFDVINRSLLSQSKRVRFFSKSAWWHSQDLPGNMKCDITIYMTCDVIILSAQKGLGLKPEAFRDVVARMK